MRVFITGDRSADVHRVAGPVALAMLHHLALGRELATGNGNGVEDAVRRIAESAEVPVQVLENPVDPDRGWVDWDKRHEALRDEGDVLVVGIHNEATSSRVLRSALQVLGDDKVELRTPFDLLAEVDEPVA